MTSRKGLSGIPIYSQATLIYNPNAGRIRRHMRLVPSLLRVLEQQGHQVTPKATCKPKDATELARRAVTEGADIVIVAGGDGTINEAVNGMVGSKVPLAILPAGTANVLAMEMRMGGDPHKAARVLSDMEPQRIGIGLVRDEDGTPRRYFLAMAGAGFDADVVSRLDAKLKNALGKVAYYIAGFQSLGRTLPELDVDLGTGARKRCSFALTSHVRNYGGDLEIALGASLLREQFESVLFEGSNPWVYFNYLFGVVTKSTPKIKGVTMLPTNSMVFYPVGGDIVRLQLDGEDAGKLPARLELVPDALTLLMPPAFVRRERERWTT
jgi:YegS/Rv2252/BmrU family lipid kinase